jgi:hypothetical protein
LKLMLGVEEAHGACRVVVMYSRPTLPCLAWEVCFLLMAGGSGGRDRGRDYGGGGRCGCVI